MINDQTAAVIIQSPNFFGVIENVKQAAEIAHSKGALLVFAFTEAVSLGLLEPPHDADIVAGELQSFAIAPSYGGPFAGVLACKEKYARQLPGRLAGETTDAVGNLRVLSDAGHARAAYTPREGDLEHLHQSGADRPDGHGVHGSLRKGRLARTGVAESFESALAFGRESFGGASAVRTSSRVRRRYGGPLRRRD